MNRRLTELYAKHNSAGLKYKKLEEVMKNDTYLSAKGAVEMGLADRVIANRKDI